VAEQRTVSVTEAARLLGVTEKTVRQRLRTGELRGERTERPQGHVWRVVLDQTVYTVNGSAGALDYQADPVNDPVTVPHHDRVNGSAGFRAVEALVAQLAEERRRSEEMEKRLADLQQERFELAGRLGYFQAELEHARATIKALEPPKEPIAAPPPAEAIFRPLPAEPEPPRRPWWKLWG
jgi:excisionase family DNA binding protein